MARNWYKKSMPTVGNVKPFIAEIAQVVKDIKGVTEVRIWGSFFKNASNPKFVLKDIDLIAVNDFFSEDLLSINETPQSPFTRSEQELADDGFDPLAVAFTKQYIALKKYNIDHWAISGNKKLLHWGPIPAHDDDWQEIRKEAEKYAAFMTGVTRYKLRKSSQQMKNRWSVLFDHHVNKTLSGMPCGWYQSSHSIDEIIPTTLKLI